MRFQMMLWLLLAPAAALAIPCADANMDVYLASPCSHFGLTFTWEYDPGTTGVPAALVRVMPSVAGPGFEFLDFGPDAWEAGTGVTRTFSIGFTATGAGAMRGSGILLGSGSTSGTGTVTGVMDECLGGLLPGCAPGTHTSLIVSAPGGSIVASNSFGSHSTIDVRLNFTLVGGIGNAQVRAIEAGLGGAVPEPGTWGLMGGGLLGLLAWCRGRRD
jgi:hypothetical protein